MKFGTLPNIDKPISRLVQGTVMCTTEEQGYVNELLDAVLASGINTFDTAHVYGMGESEKSVGAWINARGNREDVVLLGKGAHPYDGRNRVTPEDIRADIAESLERFQTDYIDLYMLHRDDVTVPVEGLIDVLNEQIDKGVIRAIGGSNWTTARLAEANSYAAAQGLQPFHVSSPNF